MSTSIGGAVQQDVKTFPGTIVRVIDGSYRVDAPGSKRSPEGRNMVQVTTRDLRDFDQTWTLAEGSLQPAARCVGNGTRHEFTVAPLKRELLEAKCFHK